MTSRVNNLEKETSFMGRRAILVTSLLERDYRQAARMLREFAGYITPQILSIKQDPIAGEPYQLIAKQKALRKLASRFRQRADRMVYNAKAIDLTSIQQRRLDKINKRTLRHPGKRFNQDGDIP